MLKQSLQQKLLQKLSPLQIQTIKLIELPIVQLEQRIKKELEENPVLEEEPDYEELNTEEPESNTDEFTLEDYIEDDEVPTYKASINNTSKDDNREYSTMSNTLSLHQILEEQLAFNYLSDREHTLGLFIIGSIDNDGYLRRDLLSITDDIAFKMGIETTKSELEEILKLVQNFEPSGVGARTLQECLLIQIKNKEQTRETKTAKIILKDCFDEFSKKHYQKIALKLNLSDEDLRDAMQEILKLNPKPGSGYENMYSQQSHHIVPDFIIETKNGEPELSLHSYNMPELKINRGYSDIIENYTSKNEHTQEDKNAMLFVRQKIDSARWFIDAIKQRQQTLTNSMEAIINFQNEYFKTGNESNLRPMILKDISKVTGLDVSTVSRVVNSKYVQCDWGIFPLRYFFSEGMQSEAGEEVTTREVKNIIIECIEKEDKNNPMKDEEIRIMLKERGYALARRTVAKYRENLNIPVARLRKEF